MVSLKIFTELHEVESEIVDLGDEMTSVEARECHHNLISCYSDFIKQQSNYPYGKENKILNDVVDGLEGKFMSLEVRLLKLILPTDSTPVSETKTESNSKVDQQPADTHYLPSLHREQKFYIRMIESLESKNDLNPKEAEIQFEHLGQLFEKFIANQCKITTLVDEASFDDEIDISRQVREKVVKIKVMLEDIFSPPTKTASPVPESVVGDHFNRTEHPRVITDFLASQFKKQKSLIEQIEWIESKVNPGPAEAETLHYHISQLHDSFVKNQTKIENYVGDSTLDDQLQISREILQKVVSLQTRLKLIFAPISSSSDVSNDKVKVKSDLVEGLNSLNKKEAESLKPIAPNPSEDPSLSDSESDDFSFDLFD